MKNKRLVVNKATLLLTIVFLFLFLPEYFQRDDTVRYFYFILGSAVSVLFILKSILVMKKGANKYGIILLIEVFIFYFIILASTILNSGPYNSYLANSIIGVGTCSLLLYSFSMDRVEETLKALIISIEFYVTINLITVLMYPEGLYVLKSYVGNTFNEAFILGHRNNSIEYCIPLVGFNVLLELYRGKKYTKNHIYCLIISSATVVLTWSVNAILCMLFLIMMDLYIVLRKKSFIISVGKLYLIFFTVSVLVIVYNIQTLFVGLLSRYLNRNVTFSSRTEIWKRAVPAVLSNLWHGYGVEKDLIKFRRIRHPNSCHNYFLDYLYYGGVFLLADVTLMIFTITKRLEKFDGNIKTRISVIFGGYFILWIATPIHRNTIFIMFAFFISSICIPWENLKATNKDNA
ncbi:MAG: O-antigen ligase family protein [Ruminococcus sp.]|nr:O-antigen ligase family protein [Ruminococcus sp.]